MRYFFFYWYRPCEHSDLPSTADDTEYRLTVLVEMTPIQAWHLQSLWEEIEQAVDSDARPFHGAVLRGLNFNQSSLIPNREQRIHPLLRAWCLNTNDYPNSASRMAKVVQNKIYKTAGTTVTASNYMSFVGWTVIETTICTGRFLPYNMSLCDFSLWAEGIRIVTPFGTTASLPWSAISMLARARAIYEDAKPQTKKIKRRTILVR